MTEQSLLLTLVGFAILLAGLVVPGWDTDRIPKRAMKRRIYWTATAVAIPVLFTSGLPDMQSAIAFVVTTLILMVGWAYFRTSNLKIGGEIYAAYEPNREPDPPPRRG